MSSGFLSLLEDQVTAAIESGDLDGVRLLGHGEFSLVMAWPTDSPTEALKRVPPFSSRAAADDYCRVTRDYIETLTQRGVEVLMTSLDVLERSDGSAVVYHRQPMADPATVGSNVLRSASPAGDHPLVEAVVTSIGKVVDRTTGFDAQFANWLWDGETATQIDLTTPLNLDEQQRVTFDISAFLNEYPLLLRPFVRREMFKIIPDWTTPERVLLDVVAMLLREQLDE